MNSHEILQWAEENERSYAEKYIETTRILREADVYKGIGTFYDLSIRGMKGEYRIPEERPIVHLDVGCGMGDALENLGTRLQESGVNNYVLIGVDVNQHMCRTAVERLVANGHNVQSHIGQKRDLKTKRGVTKLRKHIPLQKDVLRTLPTKPSGQIVILQDNILQSTVLDAYRKMLEQKEEITHIDAISLAQPGHSGDTAVNNQSIAAIETYRSTTANQAARSGEYISQITDAVTTKAKNILGIGGALVNVCRLANGDKFEQMYRGFTNGKELPTDPAGLQMAQMMMAMMTLGNNMNLFRPKMGAVLYPDYHEVQRKTPIDYASYNPISGTGKKGSNADHCDLFGLTCLREALHPMGNRVTGFTIES